MTVNPPKDGLEFLSVAGLVVVEPDLAVLRPGVARFVFRYTRYTECYKIIGYRFLTTD